MLQTCCITWVVTYSKVLQAPLQRYAELLANKVVQHGRKEVVVQAAGGRGTMQPEAEVEEGDEVAFMGADHIPAAVKSRLARWQPKEVQVCA